LQAWHACRNVGAAKGLWSWVIAEKVNSTSGKEFVISVELLIMGLDNGVHFIQGNLRKASSWKTDVICSGAVPDFMAERFIDQMQAS
jgi:23S rRNA U2552 (ribose-2'-O)-methylase RlmE/FtsJ